MLFGYCLHETDRAPYGVQLALVLLGVRLGQVYRVVLVWLVLVFAVLVWLSWQG